MVNEIDKVLGKKYRLEKAGRDSDGDGVLNVVDCAPYNPRKQGWVHDKIQQFKDRAAERREIRDVERKQYVESKKTEAIRVGKERAKMEADRKINRLKPIKRESFGSVVMGGLSAMAKKSQPTVRKSKVTRYVKTKGGKYKKVTTYKPIKTEQKQTPTIYDVFGGSKKKESNGKSMLDFKFY